MSRKTSTSIGVSLGQVTSLDYEQRERLVRNGFYAFTGLMLLFLWLPLFFVVFLSFGENPVTVLPFEGFTFAHYSETFADTGLWTSFFTSVQVATVASSIATVMGVLASFGVVRHDFTFKETFRSFAIMPIIIPGVILGVALLIFFRSVLDIPTGIPTIILTHSVYGFPFVFLPVTARLISFDRSLEESARDLGADPIEAFRDITLPIIAPAIGAGFLFAWIRSFEDFVRAFFVSGTADVLTTEMFGMITYGFANKLNTTSTIIMVLIAITLALAMNFANVTQYVARSENE